MLVDGGGVFLPFGIKDEWTATLKRMNAATKEFITGVTQASAQTKEQTKQTEGAERATTKWTASLGKLAGEGLKKLNSFNARNLYRTFRDMPVLTLAVGEGLREGAKAAMEFDRSLVDLRLSGTATADQINQITDNTARLAGNSKYSQNEILQQTTGLQKLGLSLDAAAAATENASHFSTLMNTTLAEGVDAQVKVSQLYYDNVSHMAEAGDVLAYSVKHLRIPMDEFVGAIERIGPSARLSHTPIADTVGLLKGLTEAGIPAEKSAMAISRVMSQAAKVGLTFNGALEKIRQNYQKTVSTKGAMAGAEYLESETGLRQTAMLAPIFMRNADAFKAYTSGAKDVADFTQRASESMEAIPGEKLARAMNNLHLSFQEFAAPIVGMLNGVLTVFNKLPQLIKNVAIGFGIALAASKPLMLIWGHFQDIKTILTPLGGLIAKIFAPLAEIFGGTFLAAAGAVLSKISLITGALYGLYKIIQLLKIGWDAIALHFETKGLDTLSASARQKLETRQRQGLIDSEGHFTAASRTRFENGGSNAGPGGDTSHTGIHVSGDMHVHVGGDEVLRKPGKMSFARVLQEQVRASSK